MRFLQNAAELDLDPDRDPLPLTTYLEGLARVVQESQGPASSPFTIRGNFHVCHFRWVYAHARHSNPHCWSVSNFGSRGRRAPVLLRMLWRGLWQMEHGDCICFFLGKGVNSYPQGRSRRVP